MTSTPNNPGFPPQPPKRPAAPHSAIEEEVKKRLKHKPSIRVAALNITSMMDLVLNLLLFFVLSASFAMSEGNLPATLPTGGGTGAGLADDTTKPPENPIVISLHMIGNDQAMIQIDGSNTVPRNIDDLYDMLKNWNRANNSSTGIYAADNPITIKPDRATNWKQVVDVFNAVIRARYTSVGFAAPDNG